MLCMNPLDLLKVKFQVSTRGPEGGIGRGIWRALHDIHASEGWRGLYRGLGPNVAGNASSWGLYFLLCVLLFYALRVASICPFAETIFSFSRGTLHAYSSEAITNSSAARPSQSLTSPSLPLSTFSILPKQVRILLTPRANILFNLCLPPFLLLLM